MIAFPILVLARKQLLHRMFVIMDYSMEQAQLQAHDNHAQPYVFPQIAVSVNVYFVIHLVRVLIMGGVSFTQRVHKCCTAVKFFGKRWNNA